MSKRIQSFVLTLDFRDHTQLGEYMSAKVPLDKDLDKLQERINPVTISKDASALSFKTQGLCTAIHKLMALHTTLAESVYMKRTMSDIIERRRQAKINLGIHNAKEAEKERMRQEEDDEKERQRQEDDAIAAATLASLEEAAGVKPKSKKRPRGG